MTLIITRRYWSIIRKYSVCTVVGKFEFVLDRRLSITVTLFYPEFVYRYVSCGKAMSVFQGTATTRWIALDPPRPMTHVPLHIYYDILYMYTLYRTRDYKFDFWSMRVDARYKFGWWLLKMPGKSDQLLRTTNYWLGPMCDDSNWL